MLSAVVVVALAQVAFRDDFEATVLVGDGGQWDSVVLEDAVDSIQQAGAAAHSGDAGLRVLNVPNTGGGSIGLTRACPGTGSQFARVWFRASALTAASGFDNLMFITRSTAFFTGCQLTWLSLNQAFRVLAFDRDNVASIGDFDGGDAPVDRWMLLELGAEGMGTAAGSCTVWVDGQRLVRYDGLDWSGGLTFLDLAFGPVNANAGNAVTYDYDGFEASPAPLPSRVRVVVPSPVTRGVCTAFSVETRSSEGVLAASGVDQRVSLSSGAALFSEATCRTPAAGVTVPAGSTSATAWLRAMSGGSVDARPDDLLPGSAPFVVVPFDAGVPVVDAGMNPPPPRDYGLGCGCQSADGALLFSAAALSRALLRRRRSSARRR